MQQAAAFPFRRGDRDGDIEVLLVTSSDGRWIIPKGNIDDGMEPHLAAEREAFEEGGVRGRIDDQAIGTFRTVKRENGAAIPAEIDVFPLKVEEELQRWPEMDKRERRWLPLQEAARLVEDSGLGAIITRFRR